MAGRNHPDCPVDPGSQQDILWRHLVELPYFRSIIRSVEAGFYQQFPLPSPVLDMGCGDGHFASATFNYPLDIGLDLTASALRQAARRGSYRRVIQANANCLPFPDGYFASAISNSALEHIPQVDEVLSELARVLQPGAPFLFCVPNPAYFSQLCLPIWLDKVGLQGLGHLYTRWFGRVTRVAHADPPEAWQNRLEGAGFCLETWWHYLSPPAWRAVELGHYLGLPSLLVHKLTGRWVLAPRHWNLLFTYRRVQRYARSIPDPQGTFTFYVARKG